MSCETFTGLMHTTTQAHNVLVVVDRMDGYSTSFDQTNVVRNKVVIRSSEERETYYRPSVGPGERNPLV